MTTIFDFNKLGNEYIDFIVNAHNPDFDVLSPKALKVYEFYNNHANRLLEKSSGEDAEKLTLLCAAFDRLIGFFLQLSRIGIGINKLLEFQSYFAEAIKRIPDKSKLPNSSFFSPPAMFILPSSKIYIDFESLLFHSTSVLDVLAKYYVWESIGIKDQKFFGSRNKIYNTQPPDLRADELWNDLGITQQLIDTALSGNNSYKGLRNLLMHNSSIKNLTKSSFVIHWVNKNKALMFDHELVVGSSQNNKP